MKTTAVEIEGTVNTKASKAVCPDIDGDHLWLPLSEIENVTDVLDADVDDEVVVTIPYWLAKEKQLV
jgi:hypothetical protein